MDDLSSLNYAKPPPRRTRGINPLAGLQRKSNSGSTLSAPVKRKRKDGHDETVWEQHSLSDLATEQSGQLGSADNNQHTSGTSYSSFIPPIDHPATTSFSPSYDADPFEKQFMAYTLPIDLELDRAPIIDTEDNDDAASSRTQQGYIQEFVNRIDTILPASTANEYLDEDHQNCHRCSSKKRSKRGIWRCRDCFNPQPMCRGCMRHEHMANPFHQIECWLGDHFRSAALWEVGVYIAAPHHKKKTREQCQTRRMLIAQAEDQERRKDEEEEKLLKHGKVPPAPVAPDQASDEHPADQPSAEEFSDEVLSDEDFEQMLMDAYRLYEEKGSELQSHPPDNPAIVHPDVHVLHHSDLKRIVHTNGIHHLRLFTCDCGGNVGMVGDLVAASLMPASFTVPKTFFTRQLLDFSRLCNLELKCSSYQFHQLLRRMTSPLSPGTVKSLYHEFWRMCRLWRWLKKLRWAGFQFEGKPAEPAAAAFAIFCAACPQPGINLPEEWSDDPDQMLYGRTFVADGNFKADHVQQKGNDVPLYDGAGVMPNTQEYRKHIDAVQEIRTKASCDNSFRAIDNALRSTKACDITRVVGIACARHGCYCPNGLVDLQRGEQQKNVDFAFVRSLQHTSVDIQQKVTLLYDIACQYSVNLRSRIDSMLSTGVLNLRELIIDRAIGLFHVHAHKDSCFFRFSPTFIPGLGTVAGEILESLWAALNEISISLHTSSISYRAEMMDDHATNSNHKKILNMSMFLTTQLREATENAATHATIFAEINARAENQQLAAGWKQSIEEAEAIRMTKPDAMDIYGVDMEKVDSANAAVERHIAPPNTALEKYLDTAITVQERQIELKRLIRTAGVTPADTEVTLIQNRRTSLLEFISTLKDLENRAGINWISSPTTSPLTALVDATALPEQLIVGLPSNNNLVEHELARDTELNMRINQGQRHLDDIRELIVEKSLQYSHIMKIAKTKAITTRSRQKVNDISHLLDFHCKVYNSCQDAIVSLSPNHQILTALLPLARKDLNASTALLLPNTKNSTKISLSLSWIWHSRAILRTGSSPTDALLSDPIATQEFLRVHWLRARALSQRWSEEVKLISHEMQWTVRYFCYQSAKWRNRAWDPKFSKSSPEYEQYTKLLPEYAEHAQSAMAYARRQWDSWIKLSIQADIAFKELNANYTSPFNNN